MAQLIRIEFKYKNFALYETTSEYLTKDIKNISEFKKWFKIHHFKSTIIEANRIYPNGIKIKIEDLKNFSTFTK